MSNKTKGVFNKTLDLLSGNKDEDTVDVTEELQAMDDLGEEIEKLEAHVEAEKAEMSEVDRRLLEFRLTPLAAKLLEAACDNVAQNMGSGVMDKADQHQFQERAQMFAACGNDLTVVIDTVCGVVEDPREAASIVYSTCYAVQKAANFIGNLWYRRALDPLEDEDLGDREGRGTVKREDGTSFWADTRQEQREPPYGLGPDDESGGDEHYNPVLNTLTAYTELHDYLQLLTEAFGWDPERPMPYAVIMSDDGKFQHVTDAMHALDNMEISSKKSRAKRQVRQTQVMAAAIAARRKILRNAATKR